VLDVNEDEGKIRFRHKGGRTVWRDFKLFSTPKDKHGTYQPLMRKPTLEELKQEIIRLNQVIEEISMDIG